MDAEIHEPGDSGSAGRPATVPGAGDRAAPRGAGPDSGPGGDPPRRSPAALPGGSPGGSPGAGTLVLAAAPIGRADDAPASLAAALAAATIIAAEDTRRVRRLAAALGVTLAGRVISYYEDVEAARGPRLLDALAGGQDVLLITDAGMPGISDPGYRLVSEAARAGIRVTVLPGPSAVTAAVAVSGLPSDRFCFEGFVPRKQGERARRLAGLAGEPRTMVFFESPRRLARTLADMSAAFGPGRPAVVCRELTKVHEEIVRGPLGDLAGWAGSRDVLGEITVVVGGARENRAASAAALAASAGSASAGLGATGPDAAGPDAAGPDAAGPDAAGPAAASAAPGGAEAVARAADLVAAAEEAGLTRKEAIARVAADLGVPRRGVYDAVIRAKSGS